jgi:fatty acid desaturase
MKAHSSASPRTVRAGIACSSRAAWLHSSVPSSWPPHRGASLEPYALWYIDKKVWAEALPFVSTTVHLTFPARIGALVHHIMEHTAHHVSMSVPLYHLRVAQKLIEEKLPGAIIIQRFSWRWYFCTARRCKLYDFAALRWTDFKGRAVGA